MTESREFDVVIVGSGVIGSVALRSLQDAKFRIAFIPGFEDPNSYLDVFLNGKAVKQEDLYGSFVSGGNSNIWGGRLGMFNPSDIEERTWLGSNKWPIDFEELSKLIPKCAKFLGVEVTESLTETLVGELPLGDLRVKKEVWVESVDNWQRSLLLNENPNITVFRNFRLEKLIFESGVPRVSKINLIDTKGKEVLIIPHNLVLCAGTIGNCQILSRAAQDYPKHFREIHNNIGRNVFSHHLVKFDKLHPIDAQAFDLTLENPSTRKCLHIPLEDQKRLVIASSLIFFAHSGSNVFTLRRARNRIERISLGTLKQVFSYLTKNRKKLFQLLIDILVQTLQSITRLPHSNLNLRDSQILHVWGEQLPVSENTMNFEHSVDKPIVRINLTYNEIEVKTLLESVKASFPFVTLSNINTSEPDESQVISEASEQIFFTLNKAPLLAHLMGGTSMGIDTEKSVVDSNLKVHKIENLYVAGNSVLPSGGAFGPTLISACLALRLIEYLDKIVLNNRDKFTVIPIGGQSNQSHEQKLY